MLDYKHTKEAKAKMKLKFLDKKTHPYVWKKTWKAYFKFNK